MSKQLLFWLVTTASIVTAGESFEKLARTIPGRMDAKEGTVLFRTPVIPEVATNAPQVLEYGTGLTTLELASAAVSFRNASSLHMNELTQLEVRRPAAPTNENTLNLRKGQLYVISRGQPSSMVVETPTTKGTTEGTEFLVAVDAQTGLAQFTMFEGTVDLVTRSDRKRVERQFQAREQPDGTIEIRPLIEAQNIVQWWIYYPAVLDPAELPLTPMERARLADSLQAYRDGDLQRALGSYPGYPRPQAPASDVERVYLAELMLSSGSVEQALGLLNQGSNASPLTRALRIMIGAVAPSRAGNSSVTNAALFPPIPSSNDPAKALASLAPAEPHEQPEPRRRSGPAPLPRAKSGEVAAGRPDDQTAASALTASELLALSYAHQATNNLSEALAVATEAVRRSAEFGFGWARVAELEFGFGRIQAARRAVEESLRQAPRNAQAHAVHGFLLSADNKLSQALGVFDRAIGLDPKLGNAWLGRGLVKRHMGFLFRERPEGSNPVTLAASSTPSWLQDLQVAAALEPRRSLVRSYLGKAYTDQNELRLARKELETARSLDPNDPTSFLYAALLDQKENRINESIANLQHSKALNENREVYRSRLMLDQDQAVRGANAARTYRDAGMIEWSVREAGEAVNSDYSNHSAHRFLADSYNQLRDPRGGSLRYETAWLSEFLIANLLSPIGAGSLSQAVSQQEYSRLLERNKLGFTSETEYLSRGAWSQVAAQYGHLPNLDFAVEADYLSEPGGGADPDLEDLTTWTQVKCRLDQDDTVYFLGVTHEVRGEGPDAWDAQGIYRRAGQREDQLPLMSLGWHHEWSPEHHLMVLLTSLNSEQRVANWVSDATWLDTSGGDGTVQHRDLVSSVESYQTKMAGWVAELQQLWSWDKLSSLAGLRFVDQSFRSRHREIREQPGLPEGLPADFSQSLQTDSSRRVLYSYSTWSPLESLSFSAGFSYEDLAYPINLTAGPLSDGSQRKRVLLPKAGTIWRPDSRSVMRVAFTRSLGGVSLEQDYRLEPSQVAGVLQGFRSLIPESLIDSHAGEMMESFGYEAERRFGSGTYLTVSASRHASKVGGWQGVFDYNAQGAVSAVASQIPHVAKYVEKTAGISIDQIIGREVVIGAGYRVSVVDLEGSYPSLGERLIQNLSGELLAPGRRDSGTLQRMDLRLLSNFRNGLFGSVVTGFTSQTSRTHTLSSLEPRLRLDAWSLDLAVGWWSPNRRFQCAIGLRNALNSDLRTDPLLGGLPRAYGRSLSWRLLFNF